MFAGILSFKRFVFYGFPFYLTAVEYAMRFLMSFAPGKPEEVSILAASNGIIAAGLSLVAAVLIPKPVDFHLNDEANKLLKVNGAEIRNKKDSRLIITAWLGLLILPFIWGFALWLMHNDNHALDAHIASADLPGPFMIALLIYVLGMIYTELKEVA